MTGWTFSPNPCKPGKSHQMHFTLDEQYVSLQTLREQKWHVIYKITGEIKNKKREKAMNFLFSILHESFEHFLFVLFYFCVLGFSFDYH